MPARAVRAHLPVLGWPGREPAIARDRSRDDARHPGLVPDEVRRAVPRRPAPGRERARPAPREPAPSAHDARRRDGHAAELATLGGNQLSVEARAFVLATGGIEVPRLLLASNDVRPAGLGNENDLVGRYFMEHIDVGGGFVVPSRRRPAAPLQRARLPRAARPHRGPDHPDQGRAHPHRPRAPGERAARDRGDPRGGVARRGAGAGRRHPRPPTSACPREPRRRVPHPPIAYVRLLAEQSPNPESRVRLVTDKDPLGVPRAELAWKPTRRDRRSMRKGLAIMADERGHAGLGRLQVGVGGIGFNEGEAKTFFELYRRSNTGRLRARRVPALGGLPSHGHGADARRPEARCRRPELQGAQRGEPLRRWECGVPDDRHVDPDVHDRRPRTAPGRPSAHPGTGVSRREARRRRVSRRRFIGLAAGGVVAVGAAAFGAVGQLLSGGDTKRRAQPPGSSTTTSSTVVAPAETVPAGDDSPLARIARRYLEITPEEASKDALRAVLRPEFVGPGGPYVGRIAGAGRSRLRRRRAVAGSLRLAPLAPGP